MLSVREALERTMATVREPQPEDVALLDAHGRVLLEDVVASSPLPPWDNSAMDGLAVRAVDTRTALPQGHTDPCADAATGSATGPWLTVVGTAAAGHPCPTPVESGQAVKIMTGAPVPDGADAVVMVEHTHEESGMVQVQRSAAPGQHIRKRGEIAHAGDAVAFAGTILTGPRLGVCAAVGRATLRVASQPRVGLIATGDELVAPGKPLKAGQIYASNSVALAGWVREAGGVPVDCGHATDCVESLSAAFRRAASCDVIVSTGGVSVGEFDVVTDTMDALGVCLDFWKVAMKPGKPLALGTMGERPVFGLPGNPISAQVTFLQFVRPWIRATLGMPNPYLPVVHARLDFGMKKKAGRVEFVRVSLQWTSEGWTAHSVGDQGSGNPLSLARSNGLMLLDSAEHRLHAGDRVSVQLLHAAGHGAATPSYPW